MNESSKNQELVATEQNDVIIYHSKDGKINVALMTRDGNVWLSQQQIASLFGTSVPNVNMHISNILKERELSADSVIKNYLTTASDGKPYDVMYYSLQMIIAIGFRVRGVRGTQFRQWANAHLSEYLVKGFTMDDERLKNPDGHPRKGFIRSFATCFILVAIMKLRKRQHRCFSLRHRINCFMPLQIIRLQKLL